jgi:hypothetical protein
MDRPFPQISHQFSKFLPQVLGEIVVWSEQRQMAPSHIPVLARTRGGAEDYEQSKQGGRDTR